MTSDDTSLHDKTSDATAAQHPSSSEGDTAAQHPPPTDGDDTSAQPSPSTDGQEMTGLGRPTLVADNVHVVYYTDADKLPRGSRARGEATGRRTEVHAVRGISLTLHEGESIGIVGSNGSGKSSLVTALSGLIELAEGEVYATSRPAVLGVGAALNKKLSGKRNIMLGLLALGLSRQEINDRMKDIVAFSGLGDSIDRPMKTYSSGMKARLAFTIATEVAPDILIIDEALAVGDRGFRSRAADRLEEIRGAAGSIMVVSHNLAEVSSMCTRVIWLEDGSVVADGEADEVLAAYESANPSAAKAEKRIRRRERRQRIRESERAKALEWAREHLETDDA